MIHFNMLAPEVMQAICTPMHQVLSPAPNPSHPGSTSSVLYLGSLAAITEPTVLRDHHIMHLVQILDVQWLPLLSEKDGIDCYRIDIMDTVGEDICPHLEAVCVHIDWALRAGQNVLVHCQQGISCSATIVIAYLIRNHGMSYDSTLAFIKGKRTCIKPNTGFIHMLQEWEAAWRRLAPVMRRFTMA